MRRNLLLYVLESWVETPAVWRGFLVFGECEHRPSCLISTSGNSVKTDSIRQAKVHSYPWNKHDTQYNDSFKEQTYLIINIPWFQKVPEQIHPSSAIFIYQQVLCGYHNWIHYHGNLIHLLVQKLWTWFSWNTLTKKKLKKTEKENIYLVF